MANIDRKKLGIGLMLGLLVFLLASAAVGLFLWLPVQSEQQALIAAGKLAVEQEDIEETINFETLQLPAAASIGANLAAINPTSWRWVSDEQGRFEFKLPADWFIEYPATGKMRLLDENGAYSGLEVTAIDGSRSDLITAVTEPLGLGKDSIEDFSGLAGGIVAESEAGTVIGLRKGQTNVVLVSSEGEQAVELARTIATSISWE